MVSVPEVEKPRVTEIQVRIDCNGCVQKIKKALYGINGIYDICIDLPQQKLTVIGWADPEKLVKAIKKSRRTACICPDPNQATLPPESAFEGGQPPPPEAATPLEPPPPEATSPAEPPKDQPPPNNPLPQNPPEEANPNKEPALPSSGQQKDGDVFVISRSNPNHYSSGRPLFRAPVELPAPFHVTHSYNAYLPPPYVTEYLESPAKYANYYVYGGAATWDHHYNNSQSLRRMNGNIASIFSDENPHACRIM